MGAGTKLAPEIYGQRVEAHGEEGLIRTGGACIRPSWSSRLIIGAYAQDTRLFLLVLSWAGNRTLGRSRVYRIFVGFKSLRQTFRDTAYTRDGSVGLCL